MVQRAGTRPPAPNAEPITSIRSLRATVARSSLITGVQQPAPMQGGTAMSADRAGKAVPMNAPPSPAMNPMMNTPAQPPMMSAPPAYMPDYGGGGGGDPAMARRAAVLLALTIPFIGLPVGWAFMMMEDRKRQAIGRYCANWSMIALVFHLLLSFVFMQSLASYLPMILGMAKTVQQKQQQDTGIPGVP